MNESRILSAEEREEFSQIFEKAGHYNPDSVRRFVDTRLGKTYDVFLLGDNLVLKKSDRDKEKYDRYFAGHDFSVPPIISDFQCGDDCWVIMPYIDGTDARNCSPEDSARVGKELAKIQSYYLCKATDFEECRSYFARKILKYWDKTCRYFPEYDDTFSLIEARFFSAPQTLIHDDLLPINVLLDGKNAWIIDWTYAAILPYFLDSGRFAYVISDNGKPYISVEAAAAFLDSYYAQISNNPLFTVTAQEFRCDVAISAFCQYSIFVYFKDSEKVQESADYQALRKILEYLDRTLKPE